MTSCGVLIEFAYVLKFFSVALGSALNVILSEVVQVSIYDATMRMSSDLKI